MKRDIERAIGHIGETNSVRKTFWGMDEKVDGLVYGIRQGDDAAIVKDMVLNMEGPYPLKIGRKTGLIHTCSDVVVMGAKPLFALNALQVSGVEEAEEIARDLKKQSDGLKVPIIGGNIQMEPGLKPCISFAVVGRTVAKEPIPDSGALIGDKILMLGEVVEGGIGERLQRVKVRYASFFDIIEKGIILTGGGALLQGLDQVIRERTKLPVSIADNALFSVAEGTRCILDDFTTFRDVLMRQ